MAHIEAKMYTVVQINLQSALKISAVPQKGSKNVCSCLKVSTLNILPTFRLQIPV